MRARGLVIALVVVAVGAAAAIVTVVTTGGGGSHRPFTSSVQHRATLPDSAAVAADLVAQYTKAYGGVGVSNGIPIATVGPHQPALPVAVTAGCSDFRSGTGPVPIPDSAAGLVGTSPDSPLVVWQPATDTDWELWQAHRLADGTWSACWGGRLAHESTSSGVFPFPFGLAASGISYLATTITEGDVTSGHIRHTVAVDVTSCTPPAVPPANRHDCHGPAGQVSEGSILRFPPGLAMPKDLTTFGAMVFHAIQDYGMVVVDQAGAIIVQAENPKDWPLGGHQGTDPITASWQGKPEYRQVDTLPWGMLQVVAPNP